MDEVCVSPEHNLDPAVSCGDFHQVANYKNGRQRELTDHYLLNHHFIPVLHTNFLPTHFENEKTLVDKIQRFVLFKKCRW